MKVFLPHVPIRRDPISGNTAPIVNLNPALAFGELVPLLAPDRFVHGDYLQDAVDDCREAAKQIGVEDWICCLGDSVLLAVTLMTAGERNGRVKLLRWDRNKRTYNPVEIEL